MMIFFLLTVFALIGIACLTKVIFFSIQPDQWMDQLFGWQNTLDKFGNKSGVWNAIVYKILGGCSFCFAHLMSFIGFIVYVLIIYSNGFWPNFETVFGQWAFNFGWYFIFVPTSTVLSSLAINRL
jgi:hypothetical protein